MTLLDVSLFPKCIDFAEEQYDKHWVAKEISLQHDATDYVKMNKEMQELIIWVFSFFTQMDLSVGDIYNSNLCNYVRNVLNEDLIKHLTKGGEYNFKDLQIMCTAFSNMENIHAFAYQYLSDTLGIENDIQFAWKQDKMLLNKIKSISCEKNKVVDYENGQIIYDLMDFIIRHEGLTLFSIFAALYAYTQDGLLKGSQKIVRFSMRDETLHIKGVIYVIKRLKELLMLSNEEYNVILNDIINVANKEIDLICEILYRKGFMNECFLNGLSPSVFNIIVFMKDYLKWLLTIRVEQLSLNSDFSKIKDCPIKFMETVVNKNGDIINENGDFLTEESTFYIKPTVISDSLYDSLLNDIDIYNNR